MKRYRVQQTDFDSRASSLEPIQEHWEDAVKEQHRVNQTQIVEDLQAEYGGADFPNKLINFLDLGRKPFSVVAFHNRFLNQIRHASIHGQYYPALTAACALGERLLNHLVIKLRDDYKGHDLYKTVHRKSSFDNWPLVIEVLSQWRVLTPQAAAAFRDLNDRRNRSLHFDPDIDQKDREFSFAVIKTLETIISQQFASVGELPWLLLADGECYIRKDFENSPFVRLVYLPRCDYVGYKHRVTSVFPWQFSDDHDYSNQEVSDQQYVELRAKDKQTIQSRSSR